MRREALIVGASLRGRPKRRKENGDLERRELCKRGALTEGRPYNEGNVASYYRAISFSISSAFFGTLLVKTRGPFAVHKTSSSMRTPMPRYCSGMSFVFGLM